MESVGGFGRGPKSAAVGWPASGAIPFLPRLTAGLSFVGAVRIVLDASYASPILVWLSQANFKPRSGGVFLVTTTTHRQAAAVGWLAGHVSDPSS